MIEFFKILIEEPEKQRKFGVFLVKIVLNIILSAKLYLYATSENVVPANINFNSIFEFIITGRFLVFCFLYFVSHFVLFGFLDMISIGTLNLIERYIINKIRFGKEERKLIRKALCYFELIEIDEKEKKVSAGKNTDGFHEFIEIFTKKETQDEIISLKNSLVKDLAHTFFIFTIIYYSCVNLKMNNNLINGLIISSAFILPMLYFIANALIDFLIKTLNLFY